MGKNKKNYCKNNYCDSCQHIMMEKGELSNLCDYECFTASNYNDCELSEVCLSCGQPLTTKEKQIDFSKDLKLVESAIENKNLKVICYTAPSVRVALGEEFGLPAGTNVEGKMVSALKKLGFYAVFDMNTAADFTILEEAHEFLQRLEDGQNLPMFTSCCPGWVNFCKQVCPKYIKNLTSCKSPQQMFGALINNIYAKELGAESTDLFVVSIVPCLAKKLELRQEDLNTNVGLDVDVAITTREIASLIKMKGIDFLSLENEEFDAFFGSSSGAGAIFGNTGGVMEAVLRTVGDTASGAKKEELDYKMVRGLDGVRRASINLGKRQINLAVVTGLKNVNVIIKELELEPHKYDFIEIMACEGGCIGGGGQPAINEQLKRSTLEARSKGLYGCEEGKTHKVAHKNPAVLKIYKEYLGEIGGKIAKDLLHRKY